MRSTWNGQGTWLPLRIMARMGNEDGLGLTENQKQRLSSLLYKEDEIMRDLFIQMHANPTQELTQALEAQRAAQLPDDPFFDRATEEQKNALREASLMLLDLLMTAMQAEVENTLTPEQMLQVRKLEMQLMPAMGIPFPSMFEPLGLTSEQKEEMNKIADEMKGEFDRLTQEQATLKVERLVATFGLLQGKSFTSHEEFQQAQQEVFRQFVPSEAMRKKNNDLQEQGKKFMTLLQNRLMNVLTDEQLDKMQKIMDETPESAKKIIAQFQSGREAQAKEPAYVPGPDSWRPGMPLPEQFKIERRTGRFPRSE